MSNVSGTIDFSLSLSDTTARETKNVLKSIFLNEEKSFSGTAVKVAIISGTVGTAVTTISLQPSTYRNASGEFVSFNNISRVYLLSDSEAPAVQLEDNDFNFFKLLSYEGSVSSARWFASDPASGMALRTIGDASAANFTIVVVEE